MSQRIFAPGSYLVELVWHGVLSCNRFDHVRTLISVHTHLLQRFAIQKNKPEEARP